MSLTSFSIVRRGTSLLLLLAGAASAQQKATAVGPANIGFFHGGLESLAHPAAAALDAQGNAYVTEVGREAVAVFGRELGEARRIDLSAFAERSEPRGLAVADDGAIWWTDANNARVHVLEADGEERRVFGERGLSPRTLHRPLGIDIGEERVAVADEGNHRVELFDLEGHPLLTLGGYGRDLGQFIRPADVAFGPEGRIYVADAGNARVQVFDAAGEALFEWGDFGPFPGLFSGPTAIEVRAGRVFVADSENHRLQVFALDGRALYEWGQHAVLPLQGAGWLHYPVGLAVAESGAEAVVIESLDDRGQVFGNDGGRGPGERMVVRPRSRAASAHYGMEISADGDWLAIAAPELHQVLVFETGWEDPRLVTHLGDLGDKAGLFLRPSGLDVDARTRTIMVADSDLRRLSLYRFGEFNEGRVAYDATLPRLVKSLDFGRLFELHPHEGLGAVPEPGALVRDDSGRAFVCDLRNDCVLVIGPDLALEGVLGGYGDAPGRLHRPTGVALDAAQETLFVVDAGNLRLQAFELETGAVRVLDREGSVSAAFAAAREAGRPVAGLHGIAVGADEFLYVSDPLRHRLLKLTPEGDFVRELGAQGMGRMEFRQPRGITAYKKASLIVLDHANHRGQVMTGGGAFIDVFGSRPFLEPTFESALRRAEEED